MILQCSCKHEYQDGKYGKGMRVHTWARSAKVGGTPGGWRCTVCGKEKPSNITPKKG